MTESDDNDVCRLFIFLVCDEVALKSQVVRGKMLVVLFIWAFTGLIKIRTMKCGFDGLIKEDCGESW